MRALFGYLLAIPAFADTGNAVCARCHDEIARQYAGTGMAKTSGRTGQSAFKETFESAHVTPDFRLRIGATVRHLE